jgi:hypothetical protein
MYKSVVEVKDAVKRWSTLTLQREFRVVKSSPHIYDVQCLNPTVLFECMLPRASGKIIGRSNLTRARIRAPFDGKIIPHKTTRPLPSRWSPLFVEKQLEDGRTLADYNI